jgi:hydroxymethylpyrimidine pyrophosphatase-like HAD family hydrolase
MPYYFRAVAIDYDGTLTDGSKPRREVLEALWEFRGTGRRAVLVTGRIMTELRQDFPEVERHFDAVVAENGAVVFAGGADYPVAEPVPRALEQALLDREVPVRRGEVLLATRAAYDAPVLDAVRELGLDCQLVRNRSELMILPSGVSKGTGLHEALGELGVSHHSTLAVGDAENDHALLEACELGVAVANAVASLREVADIVLKEPAGEGVLSLLRGPLLAGALRVQPRRGRLELGIGEDGAPALVPGSRVNVLIAGGPGSGKSYLAGLWIEQLVRRRYSVCVFDPEGDHTGLDDMRGVLAVGGAEPPPDPRHLDRLLRHRFGSVVLNLSLLSGEEKVRYFQAALPALMDLRAQTGLPHWIVIEEADQLLAGAELPGDDEPGPTGFGLVTYDPSRLAPAVLSMLDVVLSVQGGEAWALVPSRGPEAPRAPIEHAPGPFDLEPGTALLGDVDGTRVFTPSPRAHAHVRHWRKYAEGRLPPERRFHFRDGGGPTGRSAASIGEFHRQVTEAPAGVLRHHLDAGDFSRWLSDSLADDELAGRVRAIERWYRSLREPDIAETRAALLRAVERRYGGIASDAFAASAPGGR